MNVLKKVTTLVNQNKKLNFKKIKPSFILNQISTISKKPPNYLINSKINCSKIIIRSKSKPNLMSEKNKNQIIKDKQYQLLILLWKKLNVSNLYQKTFDKIVEQNLLNKEKYILYEITGLKDLINSKNKMTEEINKRENIIFFLKECDLKILNEEKKANLNFYTNGYNIQSEFRKLFEDINSSLKSLRTISIEIIKNYLKLRKDASYSILMKKFDKIENFFCNDYILKMKNDLNFLKDTSYQNFYNFQENDPFLLNLINLEKSEQNKINIPLENNINISKFANEFQFLFFEEFLFNDMKNNHENIIKTEVIDRISENNNNIIENLETNYNSSENIHTKLFVKPPSIILPKTETNTESLPIKKYFDKYSNFKNFKDNIRNIKDNKRRYFRNNRLKLHELQNKTVISKNYTNKDISITQNTSLANNNSFNRSIIKNNININTDASKKYYSNKISGLRKNKSTYNIDASSHISPFHQKSKTRQFNLLRQRKNKIFSDLVATKDLQ